MGLLYTRFYLDFDGSEWVEHPGDPVEFEAARDGVSLEVDDATHRSRRLRFRRGGRIRVLRVTGRFRLTWDDADVLD